MSGCLTLKKYILQIEHPISTLQISGHLAMTNVTFALPIFARKLDNHSFNSDVTQKEI